MSSGQKRLVISTRERLVSSDLNRAWGIGAAQLVDALHALLDPAGGSLPLGNGATTLTGKAGPIAAPLQAAVLDGLMVVAPVAATELVVTPGAALIVDVDGLPGSPVVTPHGDDDSVAKLVRDPIGVGLGSGELPLTPNASGSTRVDVVELRRQPAVVLEADNRDLFNPATGLFTPTSVTKVESARFEYRIRLGTPGAGLPASEQGWLPIAVFGVPNGAVTLDACAIYDVRPLVRERAGMLTVALDSAPPAQLDAHVDGRTAPGQRRLFGRFEASLAGYRVGGQLGWHYSGAAQSWLDLQDAQFLEPGFGTVANQLIYLWLAFPGGLPRWVRYSAGALPPFGGRAPIGMRGVPVLSTTPPLGADIAPPAAPLALPPGSGLSGGSTQVAALALALAADLSNNRAVVSARARRTHFVVDAALPTSGAPNIQIAPASTTALEDRYELEFDDHIPRNARRVLVRAITRLTGTGGAEHSYTPSAVALDPLATGWDQAIHEPYAATVYGTMPASAESFPVFQQWVDLPALLPQLPAYAAVDRHRLRVTWSQSQTKDAAASFLTVLGWET